MYVILADLLSEIKIMELFIDYDSFLVDDC